MVLDESASISISSIENILKNYKYIPLDKDDLIDLKTGPQKLKIFSENIKKILSYTMKKYHLNQKQLLLKYMKD